MYNSSPPSSVQSYCSVDTCPRGGGAILYHSIYTESNHTVPEGVNKQGIDDEQLFFTIILLSKFDMI